MGLLYIAKPIIASAYMNANLTRIATDAAYDGQKQRPIVIGPIGKPESSELLRLSFEFFGSASVGFPNLFQTDRANTGIRLELHNGVAALIVGDPSGESPPSGIVLSDNLDGEQWHSLTLSVIHGHYIEIIFDGTTTELTSTSKNFSLRDLRIGQGFNDERVFKGLIRNIKISSSEGSFVSNILIIDGYVLSAICLGLIIVLLARFFNFHPPQPRQFARVRFARRPFRQIIYNFQEPILFFSLFLLASGVVYCYAIGHFQEMYRSLSLDLLAGFKSPPGTKPFKAEFLLFILLELSLIFSLGMTWFLSSVRKSHQFSMPLSSIMFADFIFSVVLCYFFRDIDSIILFLTSAILSLSIYSFNIIYDKIYPAKILLYFLTFIDIAVKPALRQFSFGSRPGGRRIRFLGASGMAFLIVASLAVWPIFSTWYPVVLPNDYNELRDTVVIPNAGTVIRMGRDDLVGCVLQEHATRISAESPPCGDFNKSKRTLASLLGAVAATAGWQSEPGRLLFHHSYLFVPAQHYLRYGLDGHVPYLYGFGNTIFHAFLMKFYDGPNLTSYFVTFPIAEAIGLLAIAGIVLLVTRNLWATLAGFLLSLAAFYLISYVAIFLAPGFSPLRLLGIAVQIGAMSLFVSGSPWVRYLILPTAAGFSLFWNREFGQIGAVGQALIVFSPYVKINIRARLLLLSSIIAIVAIGSIYPRTDMDIINTVYLSFFNIFMPMISLENLEVFISCAALIQVILLSLSYLFKDAERSFRFALIPTLSLSLTKYIYNPAPAHLYFVCTMLWPFLLFYLPWKRHGSTEPTDPGLVQPLPLVIVVAAFALVASSGRAYQDNSKFFRSEFLNPFEQRPWRALGENVEFVTPEKPILERVEAIKKKLQPDDRVLLLSPFDHLLSFYVNPKRYCGHFELLTNLATIDISKAIVQCSLESSNILLVYDHALKSRCPNDVVQAQPLCRRKNQMKYNLTTLKNMVSPAMHFIGSDGELDFYRSEQAGLRK